MIILEECCPPWLQISPVPAWVKSVQSNETHNSLSVVAKWKVLKSKHYCQAD